MSNLTRKEIDRQRREEDFLKAAEKLFAEKGYHNTSIEDIAQEAKYATGTIYRYFETKEDLYATLVQRKGKELLEYLKKQVAECHTPKDKFKTLLNCKLAFFQHNVEFFRIYAYEGANLKWTFKDRFHAQMKKGYTEYITFVAETLQSCMVPGGLRPVDPMKLAEAYNGMANYVLTDMIAQNKNDFDGARQFIWDLIENGFFTPEPNPQHT